MTFVKVQDNIGNDNDNEKGFANIANLNIHCLKTYICCL